MKKLLALILLLIGTVGISCISHSTDPDNNGDIVIILNGIPLTKNIPSLSKYVLKGGSTDSKISRQTYSVLERLYSTVWFKSEKTYDDGIIETETEFIFFDKDSKMCKREYDNGIKEGKMRSFLY